MADEQTDEEVARAVQRGEAEAFGMLMQRYQPRLSRYARKFLANGDDIQDLVQEVFIKAYTNIQSFDPSRRFSPWLYRIAHNECVNALKKKSRLPLVAFDFDALLPHLVAPETAEAETERQELKQLLDQSLSTLPAKYREPLVLYYSEELDYKEIADVLQLPVSTVGVRLKRGRELLKRQLTANN